MQNNEFKNTVRELLEENILKYWIERVTDHDILMPPQGL